MNWEQLKAILWLRWQLSKNQFSRGGGLNAAISVFITAVMLLGSVLSAVGGFLAGWLGAAKVPPLGLLGIWDGIVFVFLILWFGGLLAEIQRSESIDLYKLLHLPVTLQQVFVFNYVASHFTPGIVLLVPGMLGLCAGLTLRVGPGMAPMFPLALAFVFMVTAWTYCLRGWLASLMVNKRRRRTVVLCVTFSFILISQLPNLVINSRVFRKTTSSQPQSQAAGENANRRPRGRGGPAVSDTVLQGHLAIPLGWPAYGAMTLREGNPWPALGASAASLLIGGLGLMRAYRMTIRFYRGAESSGKPKPVRKAAQRPRGSLLVEWELPWLPSDAGALALATFRSLLRAPELKMALIMPVILGIGMGSVLFSGTLKKVPEMFAGLVGTAVVVVAVFATAPVMSNAFGLDRGGFRALVLLPVRRHYVLLAKNLAFLPFIAGISGTLLLLLTFLLKVSLAGFLAGLLQVLLAFLLFSLLCNLLSIFAPYRLAAGTLQAKKPKAIVFLAAFASVLMLPVVMIPVLIPPGLHLLFTLQGWLPWLPVNLLATIALLPVAVWVYWLVLPIQGRLLQRREQTILQEVTEETE